MPCIRTAARPKQQDEKVARIVAAWPDAHFIVRVPLEAPGWWVRRYLSSLATLDERFIREPARQAGAHVFYDGPDATYIGPGLIGIHAQVAGRKRLTLAHKATARDLYADRVIARHTDLIELDLRQYETRLLRFERQAGSLTC